MSTEEFKWRVGVIHGIGECCWQTDGKVIKKITKMIWQSQPVPSMLFVKHLVGGSLICAQEVAKGNAVVFECMPDPELISHAQECWNEVRGTIIRPGNVLPMPKMSR